MAKSDRKTVDKIFVLLGLVMVVVLVVVGGLAWKASSFAKSSVETQLGAQQIFFPPKGSPAISELPAADQAQMNKYAGQQLVNGAQAKVYADNFIAYHLTLVADGQTYSQVSAQALANPTNAQLKAEEQTLFQGETLRGLLLGDGYSYWTFGQIAQWAAVAAFVGAAVMAILVLLGLRHLSNS
ncbi:MAG TPA: hypothetical protein VMR34_05700 [Candidatus Saccharimonadales bacterium]|nr:hypothetical protein [Candidatus Saccharimonadales bacterium]